MNRIMATPSTRKSTPDNLKRFHVMFHLAAISFGAFNGKHGRLVEDKTELVARMRDHAEFDQLCLEPSPRSLRPNDQVVILIALG